MRVIRYQGQPVILFDEESNPRPRVIQKTDTHVSGPYKESNPRPRVIRGMERVESAKATESNPRPRVIRGPGLEWRDLQLRIKPASAGNTCGWIVTSSKRRRIKPASAGNTQRTEVQ